MPILAMPPQKQAIEYSYFYEANAVGKAAGELREEKQKELNQVTQGSVLRQRWLLVESGTATSNRTFQPPYELGQLRRPRTQ